MTMCFRLIKTPREREVVQLIEAVNRVVFAIKRDSRIKTLQENRLFNFLSWSPLIVKRAELAITQNWCWKRLNSLDGESHKTLMSWNVPKLWKPIRKQKKKMFDSK